MKRSDNIHRMGKIDKKETCLLRDPPLQMVHSRKPKLWDGFPSEEVFRFKMKRRTRMHTSVLWLVLAAAAPSGGDRKPEWLTSYGQAQKQGQTSSKPLAVFLAPGKDGWQQLVREGK